MHARSPPAHCRCMRLTHTTTCAQFACTQVTSFGDAVQRALAPLVGGCNTTPHGGANQRNARPTPTPTGAGAEHEGGDGAKPASSAHPRRALPPRIPAGMPGFDGRGGGVRHGWGRRASASAGLNGRRHASFSVCAANRRLAGALHASSAAAVARIGWDGTDQPQALQRCDGLGGSTARY